MADGPSCHGADEEEEEVGAAAAQPSAPEASAPEIDPLVYMDPRRDVELKASLRGLVSKVSIE